MVGEALTGSVTLMPVDHNPWVSNIVKEMENCDNPTVPIIDLGCLTCAVSKLGDR
jgi:hypothetical protein